MKSPHADVRRAKLNLFFGNVPVHAVKEDLLQVAHVKPLATFRAAFEVFTIGPRQLLVVRIRHSKVRLHAPRAGEIGMFTRPEFGADSLVPNGF